MIREREREREREPWSFCVILQPVFGVQARPGGWGGVRGERRGEELL